MDLIYGLPLQTPASFATTIGDVLALGPDRLSVFSYAHVPWIKPAQKIFDQREQLPDAAGEATGSSAECTADQGTSGTEEEPSQDAQSRPADGALRRVHVLGLCDPHPPTDAGDDRGVLDGQMAVRDHPHRRQQPFLGT